MTAFCTIQDIENLLQVTITPAQLAAASAAIADASAAIQNYCRQKLVYTVDESITLDIAHSRCDLQLPELPVVSVKSVTEDGTLLTATTDYKLGQHGIIYRVGCLWLTGVQIVTVVYTHGYLSDAYTVYPDDLVDVCARAASRRFQAGLRAAGLNAVPGVQAEALGDYSITYQGEAASSGESMLGASGAPLLLRSEKEILDKYRI
jgi:hypothetical protein